MTNPRVNLKNPVIAGILAFLLPGAGHLYQGRTFKAVLYAVCILGLFFSGMAMADWKAVQPPTKPLTGKIVLLKYSAQLAVGLPSMYGLVQHKRYYSSANQATEHLGTRLSAPFHGEIELRGDSPVYEVVDGIVHLEPVTDSFGDVSLTGRLETVLEGEKQVFHLGHHVRLGKKIKASEYRDFFASVISDPETPYDSIGNLRGYIPRPFMDWFQVPMDEAEVQSLHAKLGKFHELAMVFTWIAGLLNILAIWDAVEGPAHGFQDEQDAEETPAPTTPAA